MNSMKNIIVWGTGAVLRRYYKILDEFNILYFIDKDIKKQGTFFKRNSNKVPSRSKSPGVLLHYTYDRLLHGNIREYKGNGHPRG